MQTLASMTKAVAAAAVLWGAALGIAATASVDAAAPAASASRAPSAAEVQFATSFCYRHHNNQSDVTACLARYLPH